MPSSRWTRPRRPAPLGLAAVAAHLGVPLPVGPEGVAVTGLSLDSRRIEPGDLYAALPGATAHGASYAARAVASGAVGVLTDPEGEQVLRADETLTSVPVLVVLDPRGALGDLAALVNGRPADDLVLLGVTGTQGKTTTTWLAESGLQRAGIRAAVVGTVGTRIAGHEVKTALTTPEAPDLQALFAVMREEDVAVCAMEVSSHALVKGRVDGIVFDVAVFTNLGRDHLDFHADEEEYFAAKAELFTPGRARIGLVNLDDAHGRRLLAAPRIPTRSFSALGTPGADWTVRDLVPAPDGTSFTVLAPDGTTFAARVPLPGAFNVANALSALAAVAEAGFDAAAVAAGMATGGGVPGRLEQVDAGQDWLAVVDYAHKPDAVAAVLGALRPLTPGRLICVLGAGGQRDPGKRPMMGAVAARDADVLVVTDDNPRGEDPAVIRAAVLAGVGSDVRSEVREVPGRLEAIAYAVGLAVPGDTVLVAGKGHESGQEIAGVVHPFDDREVLRDLIAGRAGAAR